MSKPSASPHHEPRFLSASVALMLPTLLVVWVMMSRGERLPADVELSSWCVKSLRAFEPLQQTLHWPFAHGGWFAASVLVLGLGLRMVGYKKELLLLFGSQGMLLLSFSALVSFSGKMSPNLDVMLYLGLGLAGLVIARRRFGSAVMTGLALILAPCGLIILLAFAASGIWASVLILSLLLAMAVTLTLATSMDGL